MRTLNHKDDAATSRSHGRAGKESVNTKTNSLVNFLVGLCAVMLVAFVFLELQTQVPNRSITIPIGNHIPLETNLDVFEIEQPKSPTPNKDVAKANPDVPKPSSVKPPEVVPNDDLDPIDTVDPSADFTPDKTPNESPTTDSSTAKPAPMPNTNPYNVLSLSEVPLFPGCNARLSNEDRIACLNEKMGRFVQRHFDTSLAQDVDGKDLVTIIVVFTIESDGMPKDVQVRAPIKSLEAEARRVIDKLPKMKPGKYDGVEVNTTYALPIKFRVN